MKKIVLMIILMFTFSSICFAKNPSYATTSRKMDDIYLKFIREVIYPSVANETNNNVCELCQTIFDENNDKLIIGCSPVVYLGLYAKDLVENYKYDLVGIGGAIDAQILECLQLMNKKYNKIVIWGTANDIFQAIAKNKLLDSAYYNVLDSLFEEAKKRLKEPGSKVVYLKVKSATTEDISESDQMLKFNSIVDTVNNYVKEKKNVITVDVTPDTTKENSEWFLHYVNKNAFLTILNDIESAKK